jgi:hypothetical protein
MANYRVSTNPNNSNKKAQNKTNKKILHKRNNKQRKMDQPRLFTLKYDLLKISVDLKTAFNNNNNNNSNSI